jgi:hypothetical protein
MLRRVALVRTDVSEEPGASFFRETRIGEVGTTQAATSNRHTLVAACVVPNSPILDTLMKEAPDSSETSVQGPHGVTSQKIPLFIVTAMKTSSRLKITVPAWHWKRLGYTTEDKVLW